MNAFRKFPECGGCQSFLAIKVAKTSAAANFKRGTVRNRSDKTQYQKCKNDTAPLDFCLGLRRTWTHCVAISLKP